MSWDLHDHTEPAECRFCPLCRALAAVRATNPDAVARMGRAVGDLVGALADLVGPGAGEAGEPAAETREPSEPPAPPRPHPVRVQRIDITDER